MPQRRQFTNTVIKLLLPAVLLVVLFFSVIFFVFIPMVHKYVLQQRKKEIQDLTTTAWHILQYYQDLEKSSVCSRRLAQESAKKLIRSLRYGKDGKHYFWVIDVNGITLVHPYRPDEGENMLEIQDANGKYFIRQFIKTASTKGEGFVEYSWQKEGDKSKIDEKVSYIKAFKPWGWIVGTGVYMDDITLEINTMNWLILLAVFLIIVTVAGLYVHTLKKFISVENRKRTSFEHLLTQEAKIRALLEAIPDMILRIDRDGVVLDLKEPVNCKPFIEPSEILDRRIIDTWHKKVAGQVIAAIERVLVMNEPQSLIFEYPLPSGEKVKIESYYAVSGKDEILATFREISARD